MYAVCSPFLLHVKYEFSLLGRKERKNYKERSETVWEGEGGEGGGGGRSPKGSDQSPLRVIFEILISELADGNGRFLTLHRERFSGICATNKFQRFGIFILLKFRILHFRWFYLEAAK